MRFEIKFLIIQDSVSLYFSLMFLYGWMNDSKFDDSTKNLTLTKETQWSYWIIFELKHCYYKLNSSNPKQHLGHDRRCSWTPSSLCLAYVSASARRRVMKWVERIRIRIHCEDYITMGTRWRYITWYPGVQRYPGVRRAESYTVYI